MATNNFGKVQKPPRTTAAAAATQQQRHRNETIAAWHANKTEKNIFNTKSFAITEMKWKWTRANRHKCVRGAV